MLTTDSLIRQALLHPVEEVRITALSYYAKSFPDDTDLMPLVIEAVERYGREDMGFRLLREVEALPQTEATVAWLFAELSQPWDVANPAQDNYCFALAMLLCQSPPELLRPEMAELATFPEELREGFHERLEMAGWDWQTGWQALRDLVREGEGWDFELPQIHRAERIVESLARHRDRADLVLAELDRRCAGEEAESRESLEQFLIEVAGRMRLSAAVPLLVTHLHEEIIDLTEACVTALERIGGDDTVEMLARQWPEGAEGYRISAAEVLEHLHSPRSLQVCRELFEDEEDYEVSLSLANALLGQLTEEAIEPVRELLLEQPDEEDIDEIDLRYRLVAVATILGATFPEYDAWYHDAEAANWGWRGYEWKRVRNSFRNEYGYDPIDPQEEEWDDELSPEEQREFASLWKRVRDLDPNLFEEMVSRELAERFEPDDSLALEPRTDEAPYSRPEPIRRTEERIGRNDPCPCGSGKKYKKCCMNKR